MSDENETAKKEADKTQDTAVSGSESPSSSSGAASLLSERMVLVVDEAGQRREETVAIVEKILPNAVVEVADNPDQAQAKMDANTYDTYVINFLMPGFGASTFVKAVTNHPNRPLLMGFAADKMSDAYDPKKGIKIKPLRKLFEIESANDEGDDAEEEE